MIPFRLKSDKVIEDAALKQRSSNTEDIAKVIRNDIQYGRVILETSWEFTLAPVECSSKRHLEDF